MFQTDWDDGLVVFHRNAEDPSTAKPLLNKGAD
jgi:hypothetical protein